MRLMRARSPRILELFLKETKRAVTSESTRRLRRSCFANRTPTAGRTQMSSHLAQTPMIWSKFVRTLIGSSTSATTVRWRRHLCTRNLSSTSKPTLPTRDRGTRKSVPNRDGGFTSVRGQKCDKHSPVSIASSSLRESASIAFFVGSHHRRCLTAGCLSSR